MWWYVVVRRHSVITMRYVIPQNQKSVVWHLDTDTEDRKVVFI